MGSPLHTTKFPCSSSSSSGTLAVPIAWPPAPRCQLLIHRTTHTACRSHIPHCQVQQRVGVCAAAQRDTHPQQQHLLSPTLHSSCPVQAVYRPGKWRRRTASQIAAAAAAQEQPVAGTAAEVAPTSTTSSSTTDTQQHSNSNSNASHQQKQQQQQQQQQRQPSTSSSSSSSSSVEDSSGSPGMHVKVLSEAGELNAVAKLRAEAYYEDDRSRFAASFKKQFAAQEAESLRQRIAPTTNAQRPQLCDCLVAIDAGGSVLGCIDIRLPKSYTKLKTIGVPDGDAAGCYLLNVVVSEGHRGQGVGKAVMRAAMARAVQHWGAERLYTHVEADNEVAMRLYRSCGFQEHSSEAKYEAVSSLGRLVLLMGTAEDVQQQQQQQQ